MNPHHGGSDGELEKEAARHKRHVAESGEVCFCDICISKDPDAVEKLRQVFEQQDTTDDMRALVESLGATGKYPEGTHGEDDEGEIRFGCAVVDENVALAFGKPVTWMAMPPALARDMAQMLLDTAGRADGQLATILQFEGAVPPMPPVEPTVSWALTMLKGTARQIQALPAFGDQTALGITMASHALGVAEWIRLFETGRKGGS